MSYSKRVIKPILMFLFIASMFSIINIVSASLYVSHVEGSAGIKDFRTITDTVSFNISSTSDITSINGATPTCQKESMRYYCAVTDTKNQATVPYNIVNQEGNTATATINVDNSIGTITYSLTNNNGNVTLTYDITDTGYNGAALCTGIERVDVWWQGSNTDVLEFENNNCKQTGTRGLAISDSGKGEFYLEVYDNIGNTKKSIVQNITIDVSMPETSNLEIWNNGLPLTTIAQNTDFLVDITFDIEEDNLTSVIADLSDITTNPQWKPAYKNIVVPLSACRINNTEYGRVYNCVIPSKVLRTNKASVFINVTAKDSAGNTAIQQLEKTFTIDNIVPEVQIITDYCDEDDICYVKNGPNKFTFQLTKDNFEKRLIYFDVGGVSSRVLNCSGTECVGFASVNCNGPTQIRILTVAPFASQDDSGNKLPYYSRTLQCDNSIPVITNIDWGSNSQLGENLLITGATVSLAVAVNEPDSKVIANAYFDKIKNETIAATCNKLTIGQGNIFNCTWSVSPIEEGYYDADVVITATDIVNNSATKTEKVRILGFKADNLTPSNLRASYSKTVPSSLNRAVLQLAQFNNIPMYAYAYYSISVKQGTDVQLLSQELSVDNCVLRERDGDTFDASEIFSEIKLSDTYKEIGADHRIDFTFSPSFASFNKFADGTRVVCNVSAHIREGKYVYKKPQILMIEVPFTLRNSQFDSPGEEYVNRIKDLEASTTDDYSSLIANLDKFMVTAQNICTIKNTLDYAGMSGVAIQLAGMALGPLGGGLKIAGGQAVGLYQDINSILYDPDAVEDPLINEQGPKELPGMGIIGQACTFMSCNLDWNNPLTLDQGLADNIEGSLKDLPLGVGSELTEGLTNSDLKNSIVMSAQKLCLPGVVYNLNKYRQMDCEYLECLKVYSASGLDVSQCEVMKASKTCAIIVGEAFELPYVRIGKNLFSNMADTIQMSYGHGLVAILGFIEKSGVCKDKTSDAAIISCHLPHALQEYISAQKKTRMSGQFYYQETRDFCTSAKCVGPECYPNNQLFGIPLPQFTPTRDQQVQMDIMKRFGELSSDTYLLVTAHGSKDPKIREENLNEWNKRVNAYNAKHGTEYPPLDNVDKLKNPEDLQSNAIISSYVNKFNSGSGQPLPPDEFNEQLLKDPTFNYKLAIEEYKKNRKLIEGNSLYVGTQTNWGLTQVSENAPLNNQRNYANLQRVLPGGDTWRVHPNDNVITEKNYYYFADNVLYLKLEGKDPQRIITYDADGKPKELHIEELKDKEGFGVVYNTSGKKGGLKDKFGEVEVASISEEQKVKDLETARKAYRKYRLEQKATVILNILLDQLGMRKFLTAEYWADKWGVGQYITEVAAAVNPEIWKNNLCNPDNGPFIAGTDQPEGTVYSCYNQPGQGCKLVLTYGAESLDYGNNTALYTISYLVGPVPRDTQFNIKLKGSAGTLNGFAQNKILRAHSYDSKATAILSNKKYTQICISFTGNFPDQGDSAKEFCRSIKDDVFRTGKPVIDETTPGYPGGNVGGGGFFG